MNDNVMFLLYIYIAIHYSQWTGRYDQGNKTRTMEYPAQVMGIIQTHASDKDEVAGRSIKGTYDRLNQRAKYMLY